MERSGSGVVGTGPSECRRSDQRAGDGNEVTSDDRYLVDLPKIIFGLLSSERTGEGRHRRELKSHSRTLECHRRDRKE